MTAIAEFDGLPKGKAGAISLDPPWPYKTRSPKGGKRGAIRHYPTMTIEEIKAMPVKELAAKNCWVFLWTTGNNLHTAIECFRSWGVPFSTMGFVWIKTNRTMGELFYDRKSFWIGMGHTTRKNAEFCLLGRIGRPARLSRRVHELIIAPRREHSRKPDQAYERIQEFCAGPYYEVFSREERKGWITWGNEAGKFNKRKVA